MVDIKIKRLRDTVKLPTKAHSTDACFDIYVNLDDYMFDSICIRPGEIVKLNAGFCTEIPVGYCALVFPRSSVGIKMHLQISNTVGVIDSDYRGEWIISLHNFGTEEQILSAGDRVAQFMIIPVLDCNVVDAEELSDTIRGTGGIGSSGN